MSLGEVFKWFARFHDAEPVAAAAIFDKLAGIQPLLNALGEHHEAVERFLRANEDELRALIAELRMKPTEAP